jgi:uncharacterized alpha-E superfamily protein
MIARVAEHCFWLHRQLERVENTARLLQVNRSFALDVSHTGVACWTPLLIVCGEEDRFAGFFGRRHDNDEELVQEYLTWDPRHPISIVSSLRLARENARMIREVISVEMWESINGFWQWLGGGAGRRAYRQNRDEFYRRVRDWPHAFYGLAHSTLVHGEPFDFMRLGMLLERAGQTTRILDVKHHLAGPTREAEPETALEHASWLALLNSCSAAEAYLKLRRDEPTGRDVVAFLLLEDSFPRSVTHCVARAWNFIKRIRAAHGTETGAVSARRIDALRQRLQATTIDIVLEEGLHGHLTRLIDELAEICQAVDREYFAAPLQLPTAAS